jgi:hypothetical protein
VLWVVVVRIANAPVSLWVWLSLCALDSGPPHPRPCSESAQTKTENSGRTKNWQDGGLWGRNYSCREETATYTIHSVTAVT